MRKFRLGYFIEIVQEGVDANDAANRAIENLGFDGLQLHRPSSKVLPATAASLVTTEVLRCRCVMAVEEVGSALPESPCVGVSRLMEKGRHNGWQAYWSRDGKQHRRQFRFGKYGSAAQEKAVEFRKQMD